VFTLPDILTPGLPAPILYIKDPDVKSPLFAGDKYTIKWVYTSGRDAVFSVYLSVDGGKRFSELVRGLSGNSYELTLPAEPAKRCIIRVTAFLGSLDYAHDDTDSFSVVRQPEPKPEPVDNYIDPQVQYTSESGMRICSDIDAPIWFKAESSAEGGTVDGPQNIFGSCQALNSGHIRELWR
jgi:hypothetical protein